jgi:alkylated DNA nucleotide flippase Atl1
MLQNFIQRYNFILMLCQERCIAQQILQVYALVRQIPEGRCTSYKHIAVLAGMPRHSRFVGQGMYFVTKWIVNANQSTLTALKFLQDDSVPWHRVLLSSGQIASRGPGSDGARRQRLALEAEGVTVTALPGEPAEGDEGGGRINWSEVGWFPNPVELELPQEEV